MLANEFMTKEMNATLVYTIKGPKDTNLATISCWQLPDSRRVLVEQYKSDAGCDIYPCVNINTWAGTKQFISEMSDLEGKCYP